MNRLECQVTSCRHNGDRRCSLPGIEVEGPSARESCQTCCASFAEKHGNAGENVSAHMPSGESSIDCKAEYCTYNENCKCTAEFVCVGCSCSGEPSVKSGTECCTFKMK